MAGDRYMNAVPFLQIIVLVSLIKPFDRQAGVFLDAMNKPYINMMLSLITFIVALSASLILITTIGFIGAAYAILFALLVTAMIKQYFMRKYLLVSFSHTLYYMIRFYVKVINKVLNPKKA